MIGRRSSAKRLAWLVLSVGTAFGGAACRDVVAGQSDDLAADLCETLAACTGSCPASVSEPGAVRDGQLDDPAWASLLAYDTRIDCAASCASARKCLDHEPFCSPARNGCEADSDCCRSTVGLALCEGGACCLAAGAPCTQGEEDGCCADAPCAANGRCGGVECTLSRDEVGDDESVCVSSLECCSNRCESGHCVALSCAPLGAACKTDTDCCSQTDADGQIVQPRCDGTTGLCIDDDVSSCDVCQPVEDPALNCCLGQDQFCYVLVDGTSHCGDKTCSPLLGDCSSDGDCCPLGGAPGYCDLTGVPHCAAPLPMCDLVGTACTGDAECCTGLCAAGVCADSNNCAEATCHSGCQLGGPLTPLDVTCGPDPACVSAVCAAQPSCCCQEWGPTCRLLFLTECGACM